MRLGYGFCGSWDQFLPPAEFAYNNSYQSSIQMAPYEALYGRRCQPPVGWFELGEARLLDTDLVRDALERIKLIEDRLSTGQSRQKSYTDRKVRNVAYMVGEKVFLRASPMKGYEVEIKEYSFSESSVKRPASRGGYLG
ncbi:uncharacterized protein [Nicotiana tomentosiformis]|uniref:uncharacterized protein n=1 Tax=Nicotiana tomentosiformis TaxID=4098 RepID=UPI00388C4139